MTAKILHVFPSFNVGGSQVRFARLANAFSTAFEHCVIALDGQYGCADRIEADIQIQYRLTPPKKSSLVTTFLEFRRSLKEIKPDLLLTYNWGAIEWAFANLKPICPHIHIEDGFGPEEARQQLRRRVWFRRMVLSLHSKIVVPSRTLQTIAERIWHLPHRRIHYIPNGIDTNRFRPDAPCNFHNELDLPADIPIVGTVTRLGPEKNLSRLIEAFALAKERVRCHLVIVGDGPERSKLEAFVADKHLKESVSLVGHRPNPEAILPSFSVYGLSSDTEQMPLGVLEAMACALPIAGVNVGDTRDMVSDANSPYIVSPNSRSLSTSIVNLLKDHDSARRIGLTNRKKVEKTYTFARMISQYQLLFHTCLSTQV